MDDDPMADLPADIRQNMTRYRAPPGLERRIRNMVTLEPREARLLERVRSSWAWWSAVGASFACGVLASALVMLSRAGSANEDVLEEEVVASHVRSLMADHLTDVASTDRHTVKPWFTGKLDFAPPVVDLAQEGFPLVGGRLDYLQDRSAAALVYRRRGHTINLFVLPARDAKAGGSTAAPRHGFQVAEWESAGMRFWAVSDVSREDLAQFVAAIRAAN